ncbi:hypothetical protein K466DRAFT_591731 [Polyporus arcularius HHB13444]|uniref:Uncharacterized protein n=1 Tax=Polyporus arcularius HHB13444 TaxID=1314778 RepID=A0A5C3NWC0_9APHY|nr:hypothetical protein K466DRAFT_591731 [Polyporus arcularius HHB13444]
MHLAVIARDTPTSSPLSSSWDPSSELCKAGTPGSFKCIRVRPSWCVAFQLIPPSPEPYTVARCHCVLNRGPHPALHNSVHAGIQPSSLFCLLRIPAFVCHPKSVPAATLSRILRLPYDQRTTAVGAKCRPFNLGLGRAHRPVFLVLHTSNLNLGIQ